MTEDFYITLGVARDADADFIKKAYRKLAMQHHPDKNPGDKAAEEKFKQLASAYEILSDSEKRSRYDRFGHAAFENGGRGFQNANDIFSSFSDIFGDFFSQQRGQGRGQSRGQRSQGPARGNDLRYICEIQLKDAVKGYERDIEFNTDESCTECKGTGGKPESRREVPYDEAGDLVVALERIAETWGVARERCCPGTIGAPYEKAPQVFPILLDYRKVQTQVMTVRSDHLGCTRLATGKPSRVGRQHAEQKKHYKGQQQQHQHHAKNATNDVAAH